MAKLITIAQFKEYVGKTIFAVPTGNNARRNDKDYIEKFDVISCGRKYVQLQCKNWGSPNNYCPEKGASQSQINSGYGLNAGYKFYSDLESIEKEREVAQKLSEIKETFRGWGNCYLNDKQIEQIHEITTQGAW